MKNNELREWRKEVENDITTFQKIHGVNSDVLKAHLMLLINDFIDSLKAELVGRLYGAKQIPLHIADPTQSAHNDAIDEAIKIVKEI